ncbi:meiotic recombination protein DMC1/LIM15 homolog [Orbicella faveolata]|uniref:meiotic recombination protein DMC1/LIM15 homolog n=1 Tax=Orbicella faveolata TaxID=48498 RepID=UPI0009E2F097|nr:meiotic recombination protein DMC1/LIM15 homolog [Orbicella faveolata]
MTTRRKMCQIKGISEAKMEKIKVTGGCYILCTIDVVGLYPQIPHDEGLEALKESFVTYGGMEAGEWQRSLGEDIATFAELVLKSYYLEFNVTAQLPGANGYTGGKVIFIDTENTFRPDRLREIADRFNLDQNAMLDNVLYCRAYTSEHQYELMDSVAAKFHEEPGVFKLMIIDSIMALFRVDFCGRGELADRQQKLAQMLSRLQKLSEEFNIAIFITNQMTADPGATMSFQADPKKPIGGHILAHASTTRISLRKGRGETRIAKIYDSPDLPENEATFAVTSGGIADAKE